MNVLVYRLWAVTVWVFTVICGLQAALRRTASQARICPIQLCWLPRKGAEPSEGEERRLACDWCEPENVGFGKRGYHDKPVGDIVCWSLTGGIQYLALESAVAFHTSQLF